MWLLLVHSDPSHRSRLRYPNTNMPLGAWINRENLELVWCVSSLYIHAQIILDCLIIVTRFHCDDGDCLNEFDETS
jgi:hypothetical protein